MNLLNSTDSEILAQLKNYTDDELKKYCTICQFFLNASKMDMGIECNKEALEQVIAEAKCRGIEPQPVSHGVGCQWLRELVVDELGAMMGESADAST